MNTNSVLKVVGIVVTSAVSVKLIGMTISKIRKTRTEKTTN